MTKLYRRGSKWVKVRCPYSLGDHGDIKKKKKDKNKSGKNEYQSRKQQGKCTNSEKLQPAQTDRQVVTFLHVTPGPTFKTLHSANTEQVSDFQVSQNKRQTLPYILKDCSFIVGLECVY
jgi:hypothetical protein